MGVEKMASYYDDFFSKDKSFHEHYKDSFYYVHWTQVIVYLKQIRDQKILEVGCGTGQLAEYLKDEGFTHYKGFDFSEKAIEIAKERVAMDFSAKDALQKSSFEGEYNTIICLEVLEHVNEDLRILSNIPIGTNIIFSVPNFDAPSHVRWFTSEREVKKRYISYVDRLKITRVGNIYICKGVVTPVKLSVMQGLLATREQVGFQSFAKRVRHHIKNILKLKKL